MSGELEQLEQIEKIFKDFIENILLKKGFEKVKDMLADDIIGIGMGDQGIVYNKEDVDRILNNGKDGDEQSTTEIAYDSIQIRLYEERYATVCGVLKIRTDAEGKTVVSSLGQLMNLRIENSRWLIYTLQGTPLFHEFEEMEAYPLKFAENVLDKYRQQEQIARNAQRDSIAIYRINFTKDVFEDAIVKNDILINTQRGELYEQAMFDAARKHLNEENMYKFISIFSAGNVRRVYDSGKTELSLEYEASFEGMAPIWLKTIIKLYTDKTDEQLKGFLYVVDIDEEKKRELELLSKAELDSLTELYNKKYAEQKIEEKLKMLSPSGRSAFFMIDLDHFKNINDFYGHQEGDRIIREAARCLKNVIGRTDIAGRLGGDEFCIYFHEKADMETMSQKAELLCTQIRSLLPEGMNGISCSIGIVFCDSAQMPFDEIYMKADKALYEQKKNGRNGYSFYGAC